MTSRFVSRRRAEQSLDTTLPMDHTHHHVAATNKRITGANTTHANPTKKPGLFRCITLYTLCLCSVLCFGSGALPLSAHSP